MPDWNAAAAGVWSADVGSPEELTPLGASGAKPRLDALAQLGAIPFPFDRDRIAIELHARRTVVRFPIGPEERLFGLGLQFMRLDQRGRTRYLRVNSDPKQDTGETHAPVPFYVSSAGYGVLVDTARIATIHCGSCVRRDSPTPPVIRDRSRDPDWAATPPSDAVEVVVPSGGFRVVVFAGRTVLEVVQRYNLFCGGGCLPPRWGLGFWHRAHYRKDAREVLDEARRFRERGCPCDVFGLEPGWLSKSYPTSFEWGRDRFPDPAGFLREMDAMGLRVNLWENPYVSPDSRIHRDLEPLSGSHTVWSGLAPDYSLEEARRITARQHDEDHVSIGVAGYKLDECDGSELTGCSWMFPAHATFPSGHDGEQMRQVYGLLLQRMTAGIFRRRDRRTYGLVRASNAGASSLPYVLYSDLYDHRQFVRALCGAGFSGLLWCPEIRSADSAEDWVRRMQSVCFSPLAQLNAWASSTLPWSFPEVEEIVLKYLRLRMRLMPYFYSAFARYCFEGVPPFRAMGLDGALLPAEAAGSGRDTVDLIRNAYGDTPDTERDDQYLAGDSLLVAPLFAGQRSRPVYLPAGIWHEFETGERFEGGRSIEVAAGLDRIPLFVRDGAIVPLMPPLESAPRAGEAVPLEILHYGGAPGRFMLFDDDGETFAFERGEYRWRELTVEIEPSGRRGAISDAGPGWRSSYGEVSWTFLG